MKRVRRIPEPIASPPPPSRVRAVWVAQRTSLSIRKVQELAQTGRIPAARLEGVWTFDPEQIEDWIRARESGVWQSEQGRGGCQRASIAVRGARPSGPGYRSTAESTDEAYERLILSKRPKSSL